MFKKLLALCLSLFAALAFAAVDVNKATQADLDSVKGIGPAIAGKITAERAKGNFKDWADFIERVKGVGEGNAAKFSAEGLTVNGATFNGVAAKPAVAQPVKKDLTPMPSAKADVKAAPAEMSAADKKAAAVKEKADKKAAKEAKATATAASAAPKK
jgi:competence protein ComEA